MKNSALFSGGGSSRGPPINVAAPIGLTPTTPSSELGIPAAGITDDLVRRVAEAKRRVADAQSKLAVKDNPYMVCISFFLYLHRRLSDLGLLSRPYLKLARRKVRL